MPHLTQEQQALKASITKSAMIWAIIFGLIVAGILYWALGGQENLIRIGAAVVGGVAVFVVIFLWRKSANSTAAKCPKCNAAFSISRTDRTEVLASSEEKETREPQEDGSVKVLTWVEEVYDITDTYTCSQCNDITTKESRTTRKKDEAETIEPAKAKVPEPSSTKGAGAKQPASFKSAPEGKGAGKAAAKPKAGLKKAGPGPDSNG